MSTAPLSQALGGLLPGQPLLPTALPALSVVEVPGTRTWSDTSIVYSLDVNKFFAETFHDNFDTRLSAIGIIVEVGTGSKFVTKSNLYWILPAPAPPTGLNGEIR
jgi:hypothetical protein